MPVVLREIHGVYGAEDALIHALGRVFTAARRERLSFLIELHDAAADRAFFSSKLLPENVVWVAEVDGRVAGFIAFADGWVHQLYIDPEYQGLGLGTRLLEVAKRENARLQLWAFEENTPAVEFYLRRGFRVVERTDGAGNEARRADVRMEWRGEQ